MVVAAPARFPAQSGAVVLLARLLQPAANRLAAAAGSALASLELKIRRELLALRPVIGWAALPSLAFPMLPRAESASRQSPAGSG